MADADRPIKVQVCYAGPVEPLLIDLCVSADLTIRQIIALSELPELDLTQLRVGIYGKLKTLDSKVLAGDRIEIYRPLQADPKEARRQRARYQLR